MLRRLVRPVCASAFGARVASPAAAASPVAALLAQARFQSIGGGRGRPPFEEGKLDPDFSVARNKRRFNPDTVGHHVKSRIQEERRNLGLPEVIDWHAFGEEAILIPTNSGALWVGQDDPRCERYMRRKKKMEKKVQQISRPKPTVDPARELERHPLREYFSTPSDLNNPITIADGLAKAGIIKPHDVRHMATQISWKPRPPRITIMGHVDHGKTTLLDFLRNTNVAAGEAGGITQSIGAFRVNVSHVVKRLRGEKIMDAAEVIANEKRRLQEEAIRAQMRAKAGAGVAAAAPGAAPIASAVKAAVPTVEVPKEDPLDWITFVDTPGHAAFKEMRESGAAATDLALLIVSATDGVQPQTLESLAILREKHVPFIVVFNKIDRQPDVSKVRDQLLEAGVEFEEEGGDVMSVGVSALTGEGIPDLLEAIQLQTSILELAQPEPARCEILVIDSHNKFKNAVAGIVRTGTARPGQTMASGTIFAAVHELFDETGTTPIKSATVGTPVLLTGFKVLPKPGVIMFQLANEQFGDKYHALMTEVYKTEGGREAFLQNAFSESVGRVYDRKPVNETAVFDSIPFLLAVKAATFGQLQAVLRLLYELPALPGVHLEIKGAEVGGITDHDVVGLTGKQQPGGVLVFGDVTHKNRMELPDFIEEYQCSVVYHGVEWVKEKLVSLMPKQYNERVVAEAKVKQTFRASQAGKGNAGGLEVTSGTLYIEQPFVVLRPIKGADPVKVYEGSCKELRRFKETVPSVEEGLECGIIMNDEFVFKAGDIVRQIARDLIERDVQEEFAKAAAAEEEARRLREQQGEEVIPSIKGKKQFTPGTGEEEGGSTAAAATTNA